MLDINNLFPIFIIVLALFLAILALLMPLFVMQIRDSNRRIEKWLAYISEQLPKSQ
jgi:hypothetical protein